MRRSGRSNKGDAREAGAATDVSHAALGSDQSAQCRAIEYVAVPQPVSLAGPEQSPGDASRGKNVDISI